MDQTANRTEPPPQQPVPGRIAVFLHIVRTLLGYGKHLDQTLPSQIEHPGFLTLAAGFGTHDCRRIFAHIQRGILRAMMLERFLLARAAQGRDFEPTPNPGPAEPEDIEALDMKLSKPAEPEPEPDPAEPTPKPRRRPIVDPDDPMHFSIPTLKELEAQIRRRSVGRTIADICLDLGINPNICEGAFWNDIFEALTQFGGNFQQYCEIRQRRRETFEHERDKRPDTWTTPLWDRPKETIREMLGTLLGEPPPQRAIAI